MTWVFLLGVSVSPGDDLSWRFQSPAGRIDCLCSPACTCGCHSQRRCACAKSRFEALPVPERPGRLRSQETGVPVVPITSLLTFSVPAVRGKDRAC